MRHPLVNTHMLSAIPVRLPPKKSTNVHLKPEDYPTKALQLKWKYCSILEYSDTFHRRKIPYDSHNRLSKHLQILKASSGSSWEVLKQPTEGLSTASLSSAPALSHLAFVLLPSHITNTVSHRSQQHKVAALSWSVPHHSGHITHLVEKKTLQEYNMHLQNQPQVPSAPGHLVAAGSTGPTVSAYWASSLTFSQGNACLEGGEGYSRLDVRKQVLLHSDIFGKCHYSHVRFFL